MYTPKHVKHSIIWLIVLARWEVCLPWWSFINYVTHKITTTSSTATSPLTLKDPISLSTFSLTTVMSLWTLSSLVCSNKTNWWWTSSNWDLMRSSAISCNPEHSLTHTHRHTHKLHHTHTHTTPTKSCLATIVACRGAKEFAWQSTSNFTMATASSLL